MSRSYKEYPPTYPDPALVDRAEQFRQAIADHVPPPLPPVDLVAEWADRPDLANYPVACTFATAAPAAEVATRAAARQMFKYSRLRKAQVAAIYRRP